MFNFGEDSSKLVEYASFEDNAHYQTQMVGQKKPNAWGMYDMHGNVWEWTADAYKESLIGGADPYFAGKGRSFRVSRGGDYDMDSAGCRSALRGISDPSKCSMYGFRLVINPSRHLDQEKQDA